jgi:hypothetical protein
VSETKDKIFASHAETRPESHFEHIVSLYDVIKDTEYDTMGPPQRNMRSLCCIGCNICELYDESAERFGCVIREMRVRVNNQMRDWERTVENQHEKWNLQHGIFENSQLLR